MLNSSPRERPLKVLILPSWCPPEGGWFVRDQAHVVADARVDVVVAYPRSVWPRQALPDPSLLALLRGGCEVSDDMRQASGRV